MENNKNDRMLEIFMRSLRGEAVSVRSLADEYAISTKSISRDISSIQNFLAEHRELMQNAELTYSHKDKAYRLSNDEFLKNKELFALVKRLTRLYAEREGKPARITDSEIEEFMKAALGKAGAEEMVTPREIIRDFLTMLNILRDNPDATFLGLLKNISFSSAENKTPDDIEATAETKPKNKISLFDIDI